jgi:hypothetical protein
MLYNYSINIEINIYAQHGIPVSSTNKIYRQDIIEILLKVALNTIKQTNKAKNTLVLNICLVLSCIILL